MEQIVPLIRNTALAALALSVLVPALWLALLAFYGAILAVAHRKKSWR
jgi:hypothetical protein